MLECKNFSCVNLVHVTYPIRNTLNNTIKGSLNFVTLYKKSTGPRKEPLSTEKFNRHYPN